MIDNVPQEVEVITLTRQELRDVMSEAIVEAFKNIGIDTHDSIQTQKDMAHLRKWRVAVDQASSTSFKVVVTTLVAGLLGLIWLGLQNSLWR